MFEFLGKGGRDAAQILHCGSGYDLAEHISGAFDLRRIDFQVEDAGAARTACGQGAHQFVRPQDFARCGKAALCGDDADDRRASGDRPIGAAEGDGIAHLEIEVEPAALCQDLADQDMGGMGIPGGEVAPLDDAQCGHRPGQVVALDLAKKGRGLLTIAARGQQASGRLPIDCQRAGLDQRSFAAGAQAGDRLYVCPQRAGVLTGGAYGQIVR